VAIRTLLDSTCRASGVQHTIRVNALALLLDAHHVTERLGVEQAASHKLPAESITLKIRVQQHVPKVLEPPLPWQKKVLHHERRREDARAVVHPPCRPELPHRGIDDWVACVPLSPRLQAQRTADPGNSANVLEEGALVGKGEVVGEVARVFAVAQLLQKLGDGRAAVALGVDGGAPPLRFVVDNVYLGHWV
jgi:hypothetical protein